jgi:predicted RNase H-like HicB family nuclease
MFKIEIEQEIDGRWIAEVLDLPGVMTYGTSRDEAITRAQALALRVMAEPENAGCPVGTSGTRSPSDVEQVGDAGRKD